MTGCYETRRMSALQYHTRETTPTYARGKMTAQPLEGMRHWIGTRDVDTIAMPASMANEMSIENQKRLAIFGISLKKFDRSTSFFVAPQVML